MRTTLLATLVTAAAFAAPAEAAPPQYAGGCRLDHFEQETQGGDQRGGTLHFAIALYDAADVTDNPVSADVHCELTVDGVVVGATPTEHVTVAGAGHAQVVYNAHVDSYVRVCTVVENWSEGSPDIRDCPEPQHFQIPPQEVLDPLNAILDGTVCPAIASLAPGMPGVVDVTPQGDVFVAGDKIWDCPPFGT